MNALGMFLLSNSFWYGFFVGSMGAMGLTTVGLLTAVAAKARRAGGRLSGRVG